MKTVKIENTKLERDLNSKAVLNNNRTALEQYKMLRKQKLAEMADINNMKKDIAEPVSYTHLTLPTILRV